MLKEKYSYASRLIAIMIMMFTLVFSSVSESNAAALGITLNEFADAPSSNIVVDNDKFYSMQGTAFDTFSGQDGYSFAISKLSSKNKAVKVVHFTQTDNGIKEVKSVVYTKGQLDHANDATVYKKGSAKYLFVARGGKGNKTAVMIKLSDFNKGVAKVYPVTFKKLDNKSGKDLRGITYVGKKTIKLKVKKGKKTVTKKVKKDVFVVEVGRRMNLVYLKSLKGNKPVFEKIDSQRVKAPKIGSRECTAQGVTYHNGNLYVTWGDEGSGGNNMTGKITSIGYSALFKGNKPNKAKSFPKVWTQTREYEFTPESVYFTKLSGKAPVYIACNTGLEGGRDYIYRSSETY